MFSPHRGRRFMGRKYSKHDILTTGQVARICNVAPRTVSKWFDTGQLRGYRIPGSRDRRIPLDQLMRFMKAHGMPVSGLETGQTRLLIIDSDADLTDLLQTVLSEQAGYEVHTATSGFEAGAIVEEFLPHVILVDTGTADINPEAIVRFLRAKSELQATRLVAMSAGITDDQRQAWRQMGYDDCLAKPFDIRQIVELVEHARK
jgi:excisionase family DNA binding protein